MADDSELDKSEEATPFKLSRAREKGSVARGMDLSFVASLSAFACFVVVAGSAMLRDLADMMRRTLSTGIGAAADPRAAIGVANSAYTAAFDPLILLSLTIVAIVALCEVIQLRGVFFSAHPLKPDFSRLNPAKGLKRIFSLRMLKEALKSIVKLTAYSVAAFLVVRTAISTWGAAMDDGGDLAAAMHAMAMRLLWMFLAIGLIVAAIDQALARGEFRKQMRMSRREVTRETKDREGDPRLRRKRKQLHAEFVKNAQGIGALPGSDMLIVNPEHYAVALGYDRSAASAPVVRAKARNLHALEMKRRAAQLNIPIFPDPALARALHADVDTGAEIAQDHYHAVARHYFKLGLAAETTGN